MHILPLSQRSLALYSNAAAADADWLLLGCGCTHICSNVGFKKDSTEASHVVPHRSTSSAQGCLTSAIGRELV
eukprot:12971-Heterococcus_DN1.PRE.1